MSSSQFDLARRFGMGTVQDEAPIPPPSDADVPWGNEAEVEKPTVDPSEALWNEVPKEGDVIPKGTRHFKVEGYTLKSDIFGLRIKLLWRCQEEPYVGRLFPDTVQYVDDATMKAANNGDRTARAIVMDRLQKAKTIMGAAGVTRGSFIAFLDSQPELKITLEVGPNRVQDGKGNWVNGDGLQNRAVKYLNLNSAAGR